jgi:hypothetical protein
VADFSVNTSTANRDGHEMMQAPQIQTVSVHMRPSSAKREPAQQQPPVSASAAVMQPCPPSSRAGSMHQQRQLASAAAALRMPGEKQGDGMPGRNPSLAVSVANTMNLRARPTSTQEGAETPVAASDDDKTIEMRAQVSGCIFLWYPCLFV